MPVQVFVDSSKRAKILGERYGDKCPGLILIDAFFVGDSGKPIDEMPGLDRALELAGCSRPVVIIGVLAGEQLKDHRLRELQKKGNVAYADPTLFGVAIETAYRKLMGLPPLEPDLSSWLPQNSAVPRATKLKWALEIEEAKRRTDEW